MDRGRQTGRERDNESALRIQTDRQTDRDRDRERKKN